MQQDHENERAEQRAKEAMDSGEEGVEKGFSGESCPLQGPQTYLTTFTRPYAGHPRTISRGASLERQGARLLCLRRWAFLLPLLLDSLAIYVRLLGHHFPQRAFIYHHDPSRRALETEASRRRRRSSVRLLLPRFQSSLTPFIAFEPTPTKDTKPLLPRS